MRLYLWACVLKRLRYCVRVCARAPAYVLACVCVRVCVLVSAPVRRIASPALPNLTCLVCLLSPAPALSTLRSTENRITYRNDGRRELMIIFLTHVRATGLKFLPAATLYDHQAAR